MLSDEEIKKVWDSITTISIDNVFDMIESGGVKPVLMNNGYIITTSIWNKEGIMIRHLSISNPDGITDPAECDTMATDILGEGWKTFPGLLHKNMFHYQKPEPIVNKKYKKYKKD